MALWSPFIHRSSFVHKFLVFLFEHLGSLNICGLSTLVMWGEEMVLFHFVENQSCYLGWLQNEKLYINHLITMAPREQGMIINHLIHEIS